MKEKKKHAIFLRINAQIGKRPWLDRIMFFFGQWLILFLLLFVAGYWLVTYGGSGTYWALVILASFVSLTVVASAVIGFFFRHTRPSRELPHIKTLITPLSNWKSFPSDHAAVATVLGGFSFLFGAPAWFVIMSVFFVFAIGVGRVYCGVHYPRDIMGGICLGLLVVYAFVRLPIL